MQQSIVAQDVSTFTAYLAGSQVDEDAHEHDAEAVGKDAPRKAVAEKGQDQRCGHSPMNSAIL